MDDELGACSIKAARGEHLRGTCSLDGAPWVRRSQCHPLVAKDFTLLQRWFPVGNETEVAQVKLARRAGDEEQARHRSVQPRFFADLPYQGCLRKLPVAHKAAGHVPSLPTW